MTDSLPVLSAIELRVLATLLEKQRTVPDSYPMSLNALAAGCNQKTSRNPVLELAEADILEAIDQLRSAGFVSEVGGGRVPRFAHHFEKVIGVPGQAAALLTVLMLRGPQTAGELRLNSERLHRFADISSVEAFLEELAERPSGPLVIELPRLPGSRENRWMHSLGGTPEASVAAGERFSLPVANGTELALAQRVATLEKQVSELQAVVAALVEGRTA